MNIFKGMFLQENISMHITSIYRDGELAQERTYKKFLLVRTEGTW